MLAGIGGVNAWANYSRQGVSFKGKPESTGKPFIEEANERLAGYYQRTGTQPTFPKVCTEPHLTEEAVKAEVIKNRALAQGVERAIKFMRR